MDKKTLRTPTQFVSSAAASSKPYSAEELAEIYLKSRSEFLGIDLEVATNGWDGSFIYDFLYCVRDTRLINLASAWIIEMWEEKHRLRNSYVNVMDTDLTTQYKEFCEMMDGVRIFLEERFKSEKRKEDLIREMMHEECTAAQPETNYQQNTIMTRTLQAVSPQYVLSETNGTVYRVLLDELSEDVRNIVVVPQNVFDVYVKQLNEDTWTIVEGNKSRYCDPLRFLSNFYNITKRTTTREEYDQLLHAIIPSIKDKPSLVSSMRRCTLTNNNKIKRSYLCYANAEENPKMKNEIWSLVDDCKVLKESLQPVLDEMSN